MSDNPRPQLYGARYEALLANRADELADGIYRIAGKHCESGDVLIQAAELPRPRRGDLLAVPATGAYTLAMGSTYNGVPRPAVVLVRDGGARVIRRREPVATCCGTRTAECRCSIATTACSSSSMRNPGSCRPRQTPRSTGSRGSSPSRDGSAFRSSRPRRSRSATARPTRGCTSMRARSASRPSGSPASPEILEAVRATGRRTAVIVGAETDVCVAQSAIGLHDAGFECVVVEDATFSPGEMHERGLARLAAEGIAGNHAKGVTYGWLRTVDDAHEVLRDPALPPPPFRL